MSVTVSGVGGGGESSFFLQLFMRINKIPIIDNEYIQIFVLFFMAVQFCNIIFRFFKTHGSHNLGFINNDGIIFKVIE